jgi:hypothetical protein
MIQAARAKIVTAWNFSPGVRRAPGQQWLLVENQVIIEVTVERYWLLK